MPTTQHGMNVFKWKVSKQNRLALANDSHGLPCVPLGKIDDGLLLLQATGDVIQFGIHQSNGSGVTLAPPNSIPDGTKFTIAVEAIGGSYYQIEFPATILSGSSVAQFEFADSWMQVMVSGGGFKLLGHGSMTMV